MNPKYKTVLFSDGLKSVEEIEAIHKACEGRVIDRYGPGTWMSNDVGVRPLNIVIKLTSCNYGQGWVPTIKLSDDIGKNTGQNEEIKLCKNILGVNQ